jgi:hypothetical protein
LQEVVDATQPCRPCLRPSGHDCTYTVLGHHASPT